MIKLKRKSLNLCLIYCPQHDFKNEVGELENILIDYEVDLEFENIEVDIFGVIYDWNPNRKNWRLYVSDTLTFDFVTTQSIKEV